MACLFTCHVNPRWFISVLKCLWSLAWLDAMQAQRKECWLDVRWKGRLMIGEEVRGEAEDSRRGESGGWWLEEGEGNRDVGSALSPPPPACSPSPYPPLFLLTCSPSPHPHSPPLACSLLPLSAPCTGSAAIVHASPEVESPVACS